MAGITDEQIMDCCACRSFARRLASTLHPGAQLEQIIGTAREIWWRETPIGGWLEAFAAHPRIGDVAGLKHKFGAFADMSRTEQSAAAAGTDDSVFEDLAEWNRRYELRFGHIFIICASGKGAAEMLAAVKSRMAAEPYEELRVAAAEQMKITELRLAKLVSSAQQSGSSSSQGAVAANPTAAVSADSAAEAEATIQEPQQREPVAAGPAGLSAPEGRQGGGGGGSRAEDQAAAAAQRRTGRLRAHFLPQQLARAPTGASQGLRSPITTHMLDTSIGKPAEGVRISLHRLRPDSDDDWESLASGVTNADGRIGELLPPGDFMPAGCYRMSFETRKYIAACRAAHPGFFAAEPFYPRVHVHFQIAPGQERHHFHIPLTWSPYGYSTYRGS